MWPALLSCPGNSFICVCFILREHGFEAGRGGSLWRRLALGPPLSPGESHCPLRAARSPSQWVKKVANTMGQLGPAGGSQRGGAFPSCPSCQEDPWEPMAPTPGINEAPRVCSSDATLLPGVRVDTEVRLEDDL